MHECKEVWSRLLVPGGDTSELFDQADEPLDLLPVLVQMFVIITWHFPVLLRRDHRLTSLSLRRRHDRIAVVRLVEKIGFRLMLLDQRLGLRDVRRLTGRQDELDRVAQGVDEDMEFVLNPPRELPSAASLCPLFYRPHANAPGPRCCR